MNHNIIYIVISWSLLAFVGYNVLSAEAADKELADALRDMKFVNDDLDDYGLKHIAIEQACKDNGGQWKDTKWCKFDKDKTGDEVEFEHQMADRGLDYFYGDMKEVVSSDEFNKYEQEKYEKSLKGEQEYQKYVAKQEEIAADEDDICANEDADTTDIKLCMSEDRLQQAAFNIGKEECKEANGDWKKDRCTYYEDEQQEQEDLERAQTESLPVIEDWGNTVVTDEEQEQINSAAQYQQEKHEQLSQSTPIPDLLEYEEEEALKQLKEPREADENQVHGNAEMEYTMTEPGDNESSEEEEEQDEPEEEEDNSDSESEQDSE